VTFQGITLPDVRGCGQQSEQREDCWWSNSSTKSIDDGEKAETR